MGPYQYENRKFVAKGCITSHLKRLDNYPYSIGWNRQSWILWSHQERERGENQGCRVSASGVRQVGVKFWFYKVIITAQQVAISWMKAIPYPSL